MSKRKSVKLERGAYPSLKELIAYAKRRGRTSLRYRLIASYLEENLALHEISYDGARERGRLVWLDGKKRRRRSTNKRVRS